MNFGDKIAQSERAVERAIVIDQVLEIIEKVSHKASARGQFWTAEKTIKVLKRDVGDLKRGDKE